MAGTSNRTARRKATKDWRAVALRLHIDGWTYRDIAKKVGKSLSTVHEGINAELAEITKPLAQEVKERRDREREIDGERLNAVIRGHIAKARRGDAEAAHVIIAALRQRAKLFGLDAPTRNEHTGRDGGPIRTFDMSRLSDAQIDRLIAGDASVLDDGAEGAGAG